MNPTLNSLYRLVAVAALGVATTLSFHSAAFAQSSNNGVAESNANSEPNNPNKHWVGTWSTSPQIPIAAIPAVNFPGLTPPNFNNQTLLQIVHTSIGGNKVRVRLSNLFATDVLDVGAAHVGLRGAAAQIVPGTNKVLTFSGRTSVTIPPGALVVSDPVALEVPALGDLSISIYLPTSTTGVTQHLIGNQTNYVLSGDQTASNSPTVVSTAPPNYIPTSYYFLTNVEVYVPEKVGAVVCLGDSITDGQNSTPDTNHRWPNFLAQRILAQRGMKNDMGVLNQGIGGNRLLHDIIGSNALSRFDRDVIAQPGVTDVILLEGINDIGFSATLFPAEAVSAEDIIAAHRQLIDRAHEAGLKINGATLTPFGGSSSATAAGEAVRQQVNKFIRNSGEYDGVIDFDAALRDTSTNPPRLLPQYDSGDHIHPNDTGYEVMANAIPLPLLFHEAMGNANPGAK
jgi:lysophospholipase L1-like esterase